MALTLFEKIWNEHVVADLGDGHALLHVDRHIVHDMGARSFVGLRKRGYDLRHPELTFATADHAISTSPNLRPEDNTNVYLDNLRESSAQLGFRFFDIGRTGAGVVHVVAPEQGIALPGCTFACGDSHTCTIGALGALAWGVGQSEILHILATQSSVQEKPPSMRIVVDGNLTPGVTPKDLILSIIRRVGVAGARGYAVEIAGSTIRNMEMEGRFTVCNMAVEMGARYGIIAPDEKTFAYLRGRPYAPQGTMWDQAVARWRTLKSDEDARFDKEIKMPASDIAPQISWGTNPEQVIGIDELIPEPVAASNAEQRNVMHAALGYMGLKSGDKIVGTPVDYVFIGSCTNARISDIRLAAQIVKGRTVSANVEAWVVPGSFDVKAQAEVEGLDRIFIDAGFQWRNSGCSMCGGMGDMSREQVPSGKRIVSTTNRNFVGRQGAGSRTHLASPPMAAAAAIAGCIVDVRTL